MLTFIRRRFGAEDGLTIIELLVALIILSIAIFALLGGLIASAASLADQRKRTAATRVATDELESLRAVPFDEVEVPDSPETYDVTVDGRTFRVTRTIEWMSVDPVNAPDSEDVKFVTLNVQWDMKGQTKQETFSTAIAPYELQARDPQHAIVSHSTDPVQLPVDENGRSTEVLRFTVYLTNFPCSSKVSVSWKNYGENNPRSINLSAPCTSDTPPAWKGDVQVGNIIAEPVPGEEAFKSLTFVIVAEDSAAGVTRTGAHTLTFVPEGQDVPILVDPLIKPTPGVSGGIGQRAQIPVRKPKNDKQTCAPADNCLNTGRIELQTRVDGFSGTDEGSVVVSYQLWNGQPAEIALTPSDSDPNLWLAFIEPDSVKFKIGAVDFRFFARRYEDNAIGSVVINAEAYGVEG